MPFKSLELIEDVKIDSIITIHYFEYMSDYRYMRVIRCKVDMNKIVLKHHCILML